MGTFTAEEVREAYGRISPYLDRNGILYDEAGEKLLDDHTLVALTIMVAESRPEEKEMMISVIMNCIG